MPEEFTPGPWEMSGEDEWACVQTVRKYREWLRDGSRPKKNSVPRKITICYPSILGTEPWSRFHAEDRANARLIAAAPKLLLACKVALEAIQHQGGGDPRPHGSAEEWDEIEAAIAEAEGRPLPPAEDEEPEGS